MRSESTSMGTERPQARFVKTMPSLELPSRLEKISSRRFVVEPSKLRNSSMKGFLCHLPSIFGRRISKLKCAPVQVIKKKQCHGKVKSRWQIPRRRDRCQDGSTQYLRPLMEKFIHNANFKKKVHFEERKAQKEDRILRGKRT